MNPRNVKIRNNLGMELKAAGRIEEARYFYEVSGGPSYLGFRSTCKVYS